MRAADRNRRGFAICAAVLWLFGVEVLPNLHLAQHDAHRHTHASDGSIVALDDDAPVVARVERETASLARHAPARAPLAHRVVAAGRHHHEPKHESHRGQLAIDHVPHAASGIAHAIALHQPPPPITTPLAVPVAETWRYAEPTDAILATAAVRPSARGPPV